MPKFKPGQSGNPKGRPKKALTLSTTLQSELEKTIEITDKKSGKKVKTTYVNMVINKILSAVNKGERWAIEMVFDRIEGKPNQRIESDVAGTLNVNSQPKIVFNDSKKKN